VALSRLADAAGRISAGSLDLSVAEPAADDEVRDLTRTFNLMAGSLKDREERLQAANAALEKANATLKSLNDSYLDMLGFVSHELKNSLGVIYTSARALDMGMVGSLSEAQGGLVRSITNSINSAVAMTRNYLDLSRIEKGELTALLREMDLVADVMNPLLDELKQVLLQRGVQLENRLPGALPLRGDRALLRIVWKNLLDNALKYGRPNGRIRIDFSREEDHLRFDIWNEGQGQPPERLERLFEKFVRFGSQLDGSRGTGLGLFITREIVQKHGGTIRAESQEGEWMRFVMTLPAHESEGTGIPPSL